MRERKKPRKVDTNVDSISIFVLFYLIVAAMDEILVFVTAMVGCKGFVAVCGDYGGFFFFF